MNEMNSLAKAYEGFFKIGAAVSPENLKVQGDLVRQHFNCITAENQMKYENTEPQEGKFTFDEADKIVGFSREMGIKIRGHAPVWHMSTPEWMYKDGERLAAPELIYERIERHTKAICERYGDDVFAWDVVNEVARDDQLGNCEAGENNIYRNSEYFKICGSEFIEKAFRIMDKYAPNAQLFLNDYNECVPEKRDRIVAIIRNLQEKGCRIDGFGMQQHYFTTPNYDELKRSIEIYAGLGLRIHITEMDISMMALVNPGTRRIKRGEPGFEEYIREVMNASPEKIAKVSEIYEKLFEIFRSYRDVIDCVTTWGVADDMSWLNSFGMDPRMPIKQYPLLFDENHQPKPCVAQMIEAAQKR